MVRFEQVLHRIEEVNETLPFVVDRSQEIEFILSPIIEAKGTLTIEQMDSIASLVQEIREAAEVVIKS